MITFLHNFSGEILCVREKVENMSDAAKMTTIASVYQCYELSLKTSSGYTHPNENLIAYPVCVLVIIITTFFFLFVLFSPL